MENSNLNNQVNRRTLNGKVLFIIVLVIILILMGVIGYKLFASKLFGNDNDNSAIDKEKNNEYVLNKFSDYSYNLTQSLDMSYSNGYYFLSGYNRYSSDLFTVFNNGKIVKHLNEDIRNVEGTDIFYSFGNGEEYKSRFIDYNNEGLSTKIYQSLYAVNGLFNAKSNGKYGLIDKYGKELLEFKYDSIESIRDYYHMEKNDIYFLVVKNNKGGVVDRSGNFVIPLEYDSYYDEDAMYYWMYGDLISDGDNFYFILIKNKKFYLLDVNNNIILESNNKIIYNKYIDKLIVLNKNNNKVTSADFYTLDGKFIKNLSIDDDFDFSSYDYSFGLENDNNTNSFILIRSVKSDNKVYLIDKDLNVKEFDNLHYDTDLYSINDDGTLYRYFINDEFYIIKKDNKFYLYDFKTDKILESDIENVYYGELNNDSINSLIFCRDLNKSCALMGMDRKFITDFNYEYITKDENFNYLKNNNKFRLHSDYSFEFTCNESFDIDLFIKGYSYGSFYHTSDNKLYNSNCTLLTDKNVRKINKLDNGYTIVEIDKNKDDSYDYEIYDNNDNKIIYKNNDDAEFRLYLGFVNNKLFFLMDKGIYSIDI